MSYFTLRSAGHPAITIDLNDFESFHHALPVWYRGDAELAILKAVTDGGTYIDVGANYGTYALHVAQVPNVRVIAVEPQPDLAEALRRSRDVNGFRELEVVEAALGAESGTAVLALGDGSGSASLRHDRFSPDARKITVAMRTLDQLCRDLNVTDIRCVKLDVEGAEAGVVRGGIDTLRREQPVVIFEAGSREPQAEVFELLKDLGYSHFWDHSGVGVRSPVPPRLDLPLTNIVAVPAGVESRLQAMLASLER